ncbi:MAG TPA: ATP-binding protein, partial [Rhodanobacteraceae bacterium]|nr:ATP-binding protein [Rhodanobacteraceae bacterium]
MHPALASIAPALEAGLRWLDCVLERELLRTRARYMLSLNELCGLHVSDAQVDALLRDRIAGSEAGESAETLSEHARALHEAYLVHCPMSTLGARLDLSQAELDLLLMALACEIDVRYGALYGYLNNDAARRHLTVNLACALMASSRSESEPDEVAVRALLGPRARLLALAVLEPLEANAQRSSLEQGLSIAPIVAQILLDLPVADPRWPREVCWLGAPRTPVLDDDLDDDTPAFATIVSGEDARESRAHAERLASERGWALIGVPADALARDAALADRVRLAAKLARGAVAVDASAEEGLRDAFELARACLSEDVTVFVLTSSRPSVNEYLADIPHTRIAIGVPDAAERAARWSDALGRTRLPIEPTSVRRLAEKFELSASRIDAVVCTVTRRVDEEASIGAALEREASVRTNEALARFATRLERPHRWEHLVLPAGSLQQLREIAAAIENRERVYRRWGLIERTGRSAGLMICFTGAPGTGKTMAVSVVANAVGLELYRIDLASVVSKYIGETEKNLERIFSAAKRSSAILLFDEADALLGKRSEIKDAHDRYANIEVAYLLQKMEEHDGVTILASNLP